jgi:transposase-like protein
VKKTICPNSECESREPKIVTHGFYNTRSGRRRRYRCCDYRKTFGLTIKTPYYRLQHRWAEFDSVAAMSVEGVNKSAISRLMGVSSNTVYRWLERASVVCRKFNDRRIWNIEIEEFQLDELRTFVGSKKKETWIFTGIEVCSRFWPSTVIGRRSFKNTQKLISDVLKRSKIVGKPLIVSDGFEF